MQLPAFTQVNDAFIVEQDFSLKGKGLTCRIQNKNGMSQDSGWP